MTASVPVLHSRTCSTLGTAAMIFCASSASCGRRQREHRAAVLDLLHHGRRHLRRPVAENHRTEPQQVVDVAVAVDVVQIGALAPVHEKRIGIPARPGGARGAVDAGGNRPAGLAVKFGAARRARGILVLHSYLVLQRAAARSQESKKRAPLKRCKNSATAAPTAIEPRPYSSHGAADRAASPGLPISTQSAEQHADQRQQSPEIRFAALDARVGALLPQRGGRGDAVEDDGNQSEAARGVGERGARCWRCPSASASKIKIDARSWSASPPTGSSRRRACARKNAGITRSRDMASPIRAAETTAACKVASVPVSTTSAISGSQGSCSSRPLTADSASPACACKFVRAKARLGTRRWPIE